MAEVPLAKFTEVAQGSERSGFEVLLEKTNGQRLFAVPDLPVSAGQDLMAHTPLPERAWNVPARISGAPALVLGRSLLYPELRFSVSLPMALALARWQAERNAVLLAVALFATVLLLAAVVAGRVFRQLSAARQNTAASKAMLDEALESMVGGFVLLDSQRRVVHWNRRFVVIYPWLAPYVAPQLPFRVLLEQSARNLLPAAWQAEREQWIQERQAQQREGMGSAEQLLPDGRCIQLQERHTPDGGLVITYHDVTDLRRAKEEIENLAFYDALTGLANRRLLLDRLGRAIVQAQRTGKVGALLFLDLDHFKALNDSKGHEMGDELLQQVARRLLAHVREVDTVARLGGDEFVVMLRDLSASREGAAAVAQRIAEKLLQALEEPFQLGGHLYQGAASIGATLFCADVDSATDLLRRADIAMYQAKARRSSPTCARRWPATSWCCTTSHSARQAAMCSGPNAWCAGSTPSAAWCRRGSSSRWRRAAISSWA